MNGIPTGKAKRKADLRLPSLVNTFKIIILMEICIFTFLAVREHREFGVYVDKLTKHIVTDVSEVFGLIDKGKKNR